MVLLYLCVVDVWNSNGGPSPLSLSGYTRGGGPSMYRVSRCDEVKKKKLYWEDMMQVGMATAAVFIKSVCTYGGIRFCFFIY